MAGLLERLQKHFAKERRKREIRAHLKANGGHFNFGGLAIELPPTAPVKLQHCVTTGEYEVPEIALIRRHLPPDLPVIELGGCLGVVSAVIERKLAAGLHHVIVEAHPGLIDYCARNAKAVGRNGHVVVTHGAIAYSGTSVSFEVSTNLHGNRIAGSPKRSATIVPAIRLSALVDMVDAPNGYTLVCDIEGAEFDVFAQDRAALSNCRMAIVEIHPDVFTSRGASDTEFLSHAAAAGFVVAERMENVLLLKRS